MQRISVVGLGLMGAALARAFHAAGHDLIVWNRSPEKSRGLAALGVPVARDFAEVLASSAVIVICIEGYQGARALLQAQDLTGRTVVQLSTGTPREAREMQAFLQARGAIVLDGAILCGPNAIGGEGGEIVLAGDAEAWNLAGPLLKCLATEVRYLGAEPGAAAALDMAWLMAWFSQMIAASHAASICRAEGVGLDNLVQRFAEGSYMRRCVSVICDETYDSFTASLEIWGESLKRVQQQGRDAGIATDIPDFFSGYFQRAVAAGFGQQNAMALFKVL